MERKNTVLLTVIAVAALLAVTVGATFAFYTATFTQNTNTNTATTVNTRNTVGGVDLSLKAASVSGSNVQYPGGYLVNGATVTAKSSGSDNYKVNYTLNGTITNNTDTELNYKLYKATSAVTTGVSGCTLRQYQSGTELRYTYYKSDNTTSSCTVATGITGGTLIDSGTVAAKSGSTAGSKTIAVSSSKKTAMALTSTSTGASAHYYLVVEYPDTGAAQTAAGASIVANLTSVSGATATKVS